METYQLIEIALSIGICAVLLIWATVEAGKQWEARRYQEVPEPMRPDLPGVTIIDPTDRAVQLINWAEEDGWHLAGETTTESREHHNG